MSEQEDIGEIVRERDDLRKEVDDLKKDIRDLEDEGCVECEKKEEAINHLEDEVDHHKGAPCEDGFHYIDHLLQCRYCGARDNGVIVNYATIDPHAIMMPAPLRKIR